MTRVFNQLLATTQESVRQQVRANLTANVGKPNDGRTMPVEGGLVQFHSRQGSWWSSSL